jgi:hypothetical protein
MIPLLFRIVNYFGNSRYIEYVSHSKIYVSRFAKIKMNYNLKYNLKKEDPLINADRTFKYNDLE